MMSKSEEAYLALFNYIKVLAPNLRPNRVHCDFERGQVNAWRQVFPPPCVIVGCLWHYAVACSKHARKLGLAIPAADNELVHSFIRCMSAAPLLPQDKIWDGISEIWAEVEASGWSDVLLPFFAYFEKEWLPRIQELSVWGMPERTNNCSETDNRMIANGVPENYHNVWRLFIGFVNLEHLSWLDKIAIDRGQMVNRNRRWSAVLNDRRIQRFSTMLENDDITPGQFLHRASWSILAAVNHGLQINDQDSENETESASDSDSDVDDPGTPESASSS